VDRHRNDSKYASVGHIALVRARGRFGLTGSDGPGCESTCPFLTGRDLVPRVWGPGVRPSQFPLLKGSPSRRPRARGAGRPQGHGRARTANRHPPSVGPGCCPVQRRRWPPRVVGGPPGPRGHAPSPRGGHGGSSGGLCGRGGPHKPCRGGRRVWRPPLGRLTRAPRWRGRPGGARSDAAGGDGAPLPVYRGP